MPKRSEKRDTAKAEYIAKKKKGEEVSLRALAGELGVSYQTLRNWKAADKWEEALPKKKRGGQPGNQNSKGKRNAAGSHDGAPPGNKNAEKDGAYSTVFFDMLSAEELKITESVPLGGREALEHEMKILKFREHKILAKIAEYESQPEDALFVSSLLDMRTPGGRGKDKKDGANQTMGMYSKDSAFSRVLKLQEALYKVQGRIAKIADSLRALEESDRRMALEKQILLPGEPRKAAGDLGAAGERPRHDGVYTGRGEQQSRAVRPAALADTAGHAAGRMAVRGGYADRQPDEPAICEHLLKRA